MTVLKVKHRTAYLYQSPVVLSEHRLMSRPRDSHDLRLLDSGLNITPHPSDLRWMHDVFGNSIAVASFAEPASEQVIVIDSHAAKLPLSYSSSEDLDLASLRARHYPDPDHTLDAWVSRLLESPPVTQPWRCCSR